MAITNDTRVRNISDDNVNKLKKLSNKFEINTTTGVLLHLIPTYFESESKITSLNKENLKLKKEISVLNQELTTLKKEIRHFLYLENQVLKQKEYLLKIK